MENKYIANTEYGMCEFDIEDPGGSRTDIIAVFEDGLARIVGITYINGETKINTDRGVYSEKEIIDYGRRTFISS